MSCILGIDASLTATGYAIGESGSVNGKYGIIPGKFGGIQRLMHVRNKIMDRVDSTKPDLVVMEALSFGSKGSAVHDQAGLSKMIEAELVTEKIKYILCAPMTLKKYVCGSAGSAKNPIRKEHMLKYLATRFGHHDVNDNNICDAIGLVYIGMALMNEWQPQIEPQRQVLDGLRKNNPWLPVQSGQSKEASSDW